MEQGNDIVGTLKLMCDKESPQDKKLLLLAELVSVKFSELYNKQESLIRNLDNMNAKIDKLSELLERYEAETHNCPVFKNRESFEGISFFLHYPKITFFIIIGIVALISGSLGTEIVYALKLIFGV